MMSTAAMAMRRASAATSFSVPLLAAVMLMAVMMTAAPSADAAHGVHVHDPAIGAVWDLGEVAFVGRNVSWFIEEDLAISELDWQTTIVCDATTTRGTDGTWQSDLSYDCGSPGKINATHYFCTVSYSMRGRVPSDPCRITVEGQPLTGESVAGSSGNFSLVNPTLEVQSPSAGAFFSMDVSDNITVAIGVGEHALGRPPSDDYDNLYVQLYAWEDDGSGVETSTRIAQTMVYARNDVKMNFTSNTATVVFQLSESDLVAPLAKYYVDASTSGSSILNLRTVSGNFTIGGSGVPPPPPVGPVDPSMPDVQTVVTDWVDCVNMDCSYKNVLCSGSKCAVSCGPNGCQDSMFTCPAGTVCRFNCDSPGSCMRSEFVCNGSCDITCPGYTACQEIMVGPTAYPLECQKDGSSCEICAPFANCALLAEKEKEWSWWYILLLVLGCLGIVVGLIVTCGACGGGGDTDAPATRSTVTNPLAQAQTSITKTNEDTTDF